MKVVIIGNGISGITTARHIRKLSNHEILVISSETEHFFSRTALMYIYMGHMKYEHTKPYEDWFWEKNRIDLLFAKVAQVQAKQKQLQLEDGRMITFDKLVIATGSTPKTLAWPGLHLKGVQGLYSKQDVDLMEENTRGITDAVIIGGGLIGIEMAEMLRSRNINVHLLIREQYYWNSVLPKEEASLINKHIAAHHIHSHTNTQLKEIIGDENGKVKAVITHDGKEIACQFVGLTIGVNPNINFLQNSEIETDRGILINEYLETNHPDIYAVGDCAQFRHPKNLHPAVEQLWYTGKMQAETLAQNICGDKRAYERGIWFNSAKFLDIEYQTYGYMFNKPLEDEQSFYWEHPKGKIACRINFKAISKAVTGFNFLGMRFRQQTANDWIKNEMPLQNVMQELEKGFFDPEFFENHYLAIVEKFNTDYPEMAISVKKKKKFLIW